MAVLFQDPPETIAAGAQSNATVWRSKVRSEELVIVITASFIITGGVAMMWLAMLSRRHFREMEHRERLAMIERGLVPSPEADPHAFERMLGRKRPETKGSARTRSAGVMMIGLGLAFAFMVTFAFGDAAVGFGLGGAFAVIGAAFLVNSMLANRSEQYPSPSIGYAPPRPASDPASKPTTFDQ
jgi:hypothetical protein